LRREDVFQFVRNFAELVETTSSRIALERVYGAANAANNFFVRGTSFELQAGFIKRLQQFVGALKEESAQLGAAIVGLTLQPFTSMRWYAVPLFTCTMRNFCVRPKRLSAWPTNR